MVSHEPCVFTLAADPPAAATARDLIGRWLADAGWPPEAAEDIVHAVSEAVSNAAEHAYPPGITGPVTVTGRIEDHPPAAARNGAGPVRRRVRVSICDEGRWPVAPASDEGRRGGLFLMAALMDDVVVQAGPGSTGTEVILTGGTVPTSGRRRPSPRTAGLRRGRWISRRRR